MEEDELNIELISATWVLAFEKSMAWTPVRGAVRLLRNKWAILILIKLSSKQPLRFGFLRNLLIDISPKVFTNTLRELERLGLITRFEYDQLPPKVDYTITAVGETFLGHIVGLVKCVLDQEDKQRLQLSNNI
jgi:DNA-binding HxlR family transcriptional regulator